MNDQKRMYVEAAKFIQNILLENNIKCYLIGGALINAIRDDGILKTDDIDFAIINEDLDDLRNLIALIEKHYSYFTWDTVPNYLSINLEADKNLRIDFFKFKRKNLNFYMNDKRWIHERISHFQTFKNKEVILENKSFLTMFRPDLFLKTVYGDYMVPSEKYYNCKGGDTSHLQECCFYIDNNDFDKIDFKIENLKLFFPKVYIQRDLSKINDQKINIFHDNFSNTLEKQSNLFYSDFENFLIKNAIDFDNF